MIKAILIDDEIHCLDTLNILLTDYCKEVKVMERCTSAKQGLMAIENHNPDLVFLDIEMPSMNGFDLLEQLNRISFAIIFTTSYDQFAIKAIRFSALDYLLKPIDPKDLTIAVNKVELQKSLPIPEQFTILIDHLQQRENGFTKIAVPTIEGFELISAENILRCEADNNYTHFFLKNNKRIIACRTLKEIEEQLSVFKYFVRVHHSYIVNLNEVAKYVRGEGGYLLMSDGASVNVSRTRKEALLKFF